jgi:hypothetical protein
MLTNPRQNIRAPRAKPARPRAISWRQGRSTALTVYGYGVKFFVDRRRLIIEDGFANEGSRRRLVLSRGTCTLQRIVVVGALDSSRLTLCNF